LLTYLFFTHNRLQTLDRLEYQQQTLLVAGKQFRENAMIFQRSFPRCLSTPLTDRWVPPLRNGQAPSPAQKHPRTEAPENIYTGMKPLTSSVP